MTESSTPGGWSDPAQPSSGGAAGGDWAPATGRARPPSPSLGSSVPGPASPAGGSGSAEGGTGPSVGAAPSVGAGPSVGGSGSPGGAWTDPSPAAGGAATPPGQPQPTPPGQPTYPNAGFAAPGASPPGYGYTPQYTYPPPQKHNGMAIASLVVSIVGMLVLACYGLGGLIGLVGAILGHVSRRQIKERGENGEGMALAGVIVGWIAFALGILIIGAIVALIVIAASSDVPSYE